MPSLRDSSSKVDPVDFFDSLPEAVKIQVNRIYKIMKDNKDIINLKNRIKTYISPSLKDRNYVAGRLATFDYVTLHSRKYLLLKQWLPLVFAYNKDERIPLDNILINEPDVIVAEGKYKSNPVVIKWVKKTDLTAQYEIDIYDKLNRMGARIPCYTGKFKMFEQPVLITEKLDRLDNTDSPYKLGRQILRQLQIIHKFGVHCDIKPDNILKKGKKYYLIDFGCLTTTKFGNGYLRWVWNPYYASQPRFKSNQQTSCKYDFIELGYTMKAIQNWNNGLRSFDSKSEIKGKLKKYMSRVIELGEEHSPVNFIHEELINILK
jgi:hypothetical protein